MEGESPKQRAQDPCYRTILAVDVEGYGRDSRTDPIRVQIRRRMATWFVALLNEAGAAEDQYVTSDTGDGCLFSIDPHVPRTRLLAGVVASLPGRVDADNQGRPAAERVRLRVVLHGGEVLADPDPIQGDAVIHASRLLDSAVARDCLAVSNRPLVAVVSEPIFDGIVKQGYPSLDRDSWHPITVRAKDRQIRAWLHVPGDLQAPRRARGKPRRAPNSIPHELPAGIGTAFTGRRHELDQLSSLLDAQGADAIIVSAIDGAAGIGKTALALYAAHRLADRFPDGQLYADLDGFTPGMQPRPPLEIITRFLGSLGVDRRQVPTELDAAAAFYRTVLAGRRLLILLDNARNAAQVRPLLPGSASCVVLVTSRDRLADLDGVASLPLDVLPESDAVDLLGQLAGSERIQAEPEAAVRIVRACGCLPLAVRIAGALLDSRPKWPASALADRLADEYHRLDRLQSGELAVRTPFAVSYQPLISDHPKAARAFRLLALLDGPDLGVHTAAALLDEPSDDVEELLERLVDTRLLESPMPGRYEFHDLLRLFARELAARNDPEADRATALTRVLGFYLSMTKHAVDFLRPAAAAQPGRGSSPYGVSFDDRDAALSWLETERPNLVAAVRQADNTIGIPPKLSGQLADALALFFDQQGHWQVWAQVAQIALDLAVADGDQSGEATALSRLGRVHIRRGDYEEAATCQERALGLYRTLGDQFGQAAALADLGRVYHRRGRHDEAASFHEQALGLYRILGDQFGQANTLTSLGRVQRDQGHYDRAVISLQQALRLHHGLGNRPGEANALTSLGIIFRMLERLDEAERNLQRALDLYQEFRNWLGQANVLNNLGIVYRQQGRHDDAIACHRKAINMHETLNNRSGQAEALLHLGLTLDEMGRGAHARQHWRDALALYEQLSVPDASQVRTLLARPSHVTQRSGSNPDA
jgi:tetratricopeptide (TPR) repeat protein